MKQFTALDRIEALPAGHSKCYDVGRWSILVIRVGEDFYAIENRCTHDDQGLEGGELEDGAIVCPRHGARFCLKTGDALSPPAYEPVTTFEVQCQNGFFGVLI